MVNLVKKLFLTALMAISLAGCNPTPNYSPEITSNPPTEGNEGEPYEYFLKVTDSNIDDINKLKAAFQFAPPWLAMTYVDSATRKISGVLPLVESDTEFPVSVNLSDPQGASALQDWILKVKNTSDEDPSIIVVPSISSTSGTVPLELMVGVDGTSRDGTITNYKLLQGTEVILNSDSRVIDKKLMITEPGTKEFYWVLTDSKGVEGRAGPIEVPVDPLVQRSDLSVAITLLNTPYYVGDKFTPRARFTNNTSPYTSLTSDLNTHLLEYKLFGKIGSGIYEQILAERFQDDLKVTLKRNESTNSRGYLEFEQTLANQIKFTIKDGEAKYGGILFPAYGFSITRYVDHSGHNLARVGTDIALMRMEYYLSNNENQTYTFISLSPEFQVLEN